MSAGTFGFLIANILITIVAAYVILALFLIQPLRTYKIVGLGIAVVVTALLTFASASVSGAAALNWLGWAIGIAFIAWRATRKTKGKLDEKTAP